MELHPDYGLTLIKDNYNTFQPDTFNKDDCAKLRADKWKTCHPHSDLQPCTADMSVDELKILFKQHQSCHQFRVAENQSLCFDKPDPGHIKAEQVQLHHLKQCRLLIDAKSVSNPKIDTKSVSNPKIDTTKDANIDTTKDAKTNRKEKKTKTDTTLQTKKKDTPQTKQIESIHSKSQLKYKWWVYVLGIIAIIGLGFFLFYVY